MASTNKTTNYELSQFEGTDKPSWEADYNADMLIIDTNLKAVSDVANGASGDISTLDGRLTTAEGNISTNANDIDALEGRADALEAGQTSDDGRLDALEAEQIVQNTAIESNTRLGYNLARPYDSASTYAVGAYVLFQDTLYKCTTAISTGEAFDPSKWLAIKATDEINSSGMTFEVLTDSAVIDNVTVGHSGNPSSADWTNFTLYSHNETYYKYGRLNILKFTFQTRNIPVNIWTASIYFDYTDVAFDTTQITNPIFWCDGYQALDAQGSQNYGSILLSYEAHLNTSNNKKRIVTQATKFYGNPATGDIAFNGNIYMMWFS